MSILSDLYCEYTPFCEAINPHNDEEYRELTAEIQKLEEEFFKHLSESEQKTFEEIISLHYSRVFVENILRFEKAFSLGAKTVIEVYENTQ